MANVTNELKATFTTMAENLAKEYNPYKEASIKYFIGGKPMYIFDGKPFTEEEITKMYVDVAKQDIETGYLERSEGYDDIYYINARYDDGKAYYLGQKYAEDTLATLPKCSIITDY